MTEILLNPRQKEAVEYTKGPLLVIAGAGTGKTRVITEKIKYLIEEAGLKADEILAVTYTEKATQEMEERVQDCLQDKKLLPDIETLHGLCFRILRESGLEIGLSTDFTLITRPEQILLMHQNFSKFDLDYYRPLKDPKSFISDLIQHFNVLKSENISEKKYFEYVSHLKNKEQLPDQGIQAEEIKKYEEILNAYKKYNELLRENNFVDYGDAIQLVFQLFKTRESVLKKYQDKYKYVLVDEYQDLNVVQNEVIKLLVGNSGNICVVGDDDQSIFRFQGASLSNIMSFERDFSNVKKIVLTENYRSGQKILDAAYELIQNNNPDRLEIKSGIEKKLQAENKVSANIFKITATTFSDELYFVLNEIKKLKKEGVNYSEMAVVFRNHATGELLIPLFKNEKIPYRVVEGVGLYDREEIILVRNIIKFLLDPDDSINLFYLLSIDYFKIDAWKIIRLNHLAERKGKSLFSIVQEYLKELSDKQDLSLGLTHEDEDKLKLIFSKLENLLNLQFKRSAIVVLYEILYGELNLVKLIQNHEASKLEADQKILNLAKFYRRLEKFELTTKDRTLRNFDRMLDIFIEAGEDPLQEEVKAEIDAVSMLSIHKSKGLEFDTVFMMGLKARTFPSDNRSLRIPIPLDLLSSAAPTRDFHVKEERRLMYVGMTRAKRNLYISYSENGLKEGKRVTKPSIFFGEVLDSYAKNLEFKNNENTFFEDILKVKNNISFVPEIRADLKVSTLNTSIRLSYSNIRTFRDCPLKFKYQKIFAIPSKRTLATSFGKYIHRVLEFLHKEINQNRVIDWTRVEEYYVKNFDLDADLFTDEKHRNQYLEEGLKILHNYYDSNQISFKKALYLERRFSLPINNLKVSGVIDRIDSLDYEGNVEVIDYKTGSSKTLDMLKKEEYSFLQLYIYAIACQDLLNKNAIKLSYYFLTDGSKVTIEPDPVDLAETQNLIEQVAEEIKLSDFEAKPEEYKCRFCEYNKICPAQSNRF